MAAPGLLRATLTLLAGGAAAQALPLLLGPWLTRLYSPAEFGHYHLFVAVALNVAVVACARYEFALPLARDEAEAAALRSLGWRILAAVTGAAALAALAWAWAAGAAWPLWLPLAVAVLGALSLATLEATRRQRFRVLAAARVLQYGGGALLQGLAGLGKAGVHGLVAMPLLAAAAAAALLRWPRGEAVARSQWLAAARRHRDFPLLNTPHAFAGALLDTVSLALIVAWLGPAAAGAWGLAMRYLKAPATLIGGALSQALYPQLSACSPQAGRRLVRRAMLWLGLIAAPLVAALWGAGPWLFVTAFGTEWREAGELARSLALYIGLHFVASPLAVVTMAWGAQAWALGLAVVGQVLFVAALAFGLQWGGLVGAGWAVSAAMALYFGWYFLRLATWSAARRVEGAA
jgi:O-antigen/teichoic acid export membrane protein